MRVAFLGCLLCAACTMASEPGPGCHDPQTTSFVVAERMSSCEDGWTEPDLKLCAQTRGDFDRNTCEVTAAYICQGGVIVSAVYSFRADEPAFGTEIYHRIENSCRVERDMVEQ